MKFFVLTVFVLMYVLIIAFPKYKMYVSCGASVLLSVSLLIAKNIDFVQILQSIDYNIILMLLGIMITVGLFNDSGMPNKLAEDFVCKIPNTMVIFVLLSLLSGIVSAFIDNVATVLMLAPIGIAISKKTDTSPIPVIIAISVSSNLQGAATLVGDTTSIMLGSAIDMSFMDFFFWNGRFSIFWAVEIGMLLTVPVLFFIFRKSNKRISLTPQKVEVKSYLPTILLLSTIALLVIFSFVPNKIDIANGIICISVGIIGLIVYLIKIIKDNKAVAKKSFSNLLKSSIDYETIIFLTTLFVIIYIVEKVGIINDISKFFVKIGGNNLFLLYTLIVFGSVLISAFIDNIPYVATMLPVISGIVNEIGAPWNIKVLLCFGLLCGATLGGNLTPIGASANVVGIGLLNKEGYTVKNSDFFKIGIPFTAVAVLSGYLFCWFVWAF